MAEYDPPVEPVKEPEKDPETDPKPDLDALLATERVKTVESQKKLEENQIAYDARMKQLEQMLQNKFADKTPPPTADPVAPTATADDFLTPEGAAEASRRIAIEEGKRAANEMGLQIEQVHGKALRDTRAAQFDLKLEGIKTRKHYKYVETALSAAIESNPSIRYAPEALDILYNNIAGSLVDDILAGEKPDEPVADPKPVSTSLTSPGGKLVAPAGPVTTPAPSGGEITAAEEDIRAKFAPFIQSMRKDGSAYTPEQYARSKRERSGILEDIPILEEK